MPVTVVRIAGSEDETVTGGHCQRPDSGDKPVHYTQPQPVVEEARRPVVVGVDGSETSRRAFDFRTGRSTTARRAAACDVLLAAQGFGRYSGL